MSDNKARRAALRAPFPWFGGKSAVADIVWSRLGDVPNYVEPFFGSGAVLLARPHPGKIETINDKDHFVANFWRAVKHDPEAVARWADWPVNETDLHARHWWLITEGAERLRRIEGDPYLYDAQVAGWWVWGLCIWIGHGWCSGGGPWQWGTDGWMPPERCAGMGINRKRPHVSNAGMGINRQLPHVGNAGRGINRQMPHVGNAGMGINLMLRDRNGGNSMRCEQRLAFILDWMMALADRLRDVRVCAGDWTRVCGPSVTAKHGVTGLFLDPPYSAEADRCVLYAVDDMEVAHAVREWAIEAGRDPLMRICLAGYEGEHDMPPDWEVVAWKTSGGYGSQGQGRGRANAGRERLWFSPACLKPEVGRTLFDMLVDETVDESEVEA